MITFVLRVINISITFFFVLYSLKVFEKDLLLTLKVKKVSFGKQLSKKKHSKM